MSAAHAWARRVLHDQTEVSAFIPPRLAEIARQHNLGVHVENWREDARLHQQHLPLQHVVGSLKRDRDNPAPRSRTKSLSTSGRRYALPVTKHEHEIQTSCGSASLSRGEDAIPPAHLISYPPARKRRRTSLSSWSSTPLLTPSDMEYQFSYQIPGTAQVPFKMEAYPKLEEIVRSSAFVADEHDSFSARNVVFPEQHVDFVYPYYDQTSRRLLKYEADDPTWDNPPPLTYDADQVELDVKSAFENFIDFSNDGPCKAKI